MMIESTAVNGRFGVMAAVTPQKRQCEIASLYPAGNFVEAATTPSRWDVSGHSKRHTQNRHLNNNGKIY